MCAEYIWGLLVGVEFHGQFLISQFTCMSLIWLFFGRIQKWTLKRSIPTIYIYIYMTLEKQGGKRDYYLTSIYIK